MAMAPKVKEANTRLQASPIPPTPPLLPVPDDIALPGDTLCAPCAALNLTPHRFIVWPHDKEYGQWTGRHTKPVPLSLVTMVRGNTNCPLCRLLLTSLGRIDRVPDVDRRGRTLYVGISWGDNGHTPSQDDPWATLADIRAIFPSLILESGRFPDIDVEAINAFPSIALLANDAPPKTPRDALPHLPRLVRPNIIDFDLVRRWFSICEARHGSVCNSAHTMRQMDWNSPKTAVPAFRCIDLDRDCLVLLRATVAPDDPRYAALSYVWGRAGSDEEFFKTLRANVTERELPGFFAREDSQRRLPTTIRDAMTVTRRIGLRYLWVDSLCIVQDDSGSDWLEAIRKMDVVYGAAYVVICAAGSPSAFGGIDGVVTERGPAGGGKRNVEQIAGGFRLARRGDDNNDDDSLPYYQRGWTYQEEHFASRSLVFSGGGVTLSCRSGVIFSENTTDDTSWIDTPRTNSFPGDGNDIGEIEGKIQNYTPRQLTVETDIYRAFAGVARQIGRNLKCDLCQGLPTRFFDWFLLWEPLRGPYATQHRRMAAPSWSWAGWHNQSWSRIWDWYTRDMKVVRRGIRKRTWIIWYQRISHTSTRCVAIRKRTKDDEKKGLNIYGGKARKQERFGIDCSVTEPTARVLVADGLPSYTEDVCGEGPGSGFLQFWTASAVFELRLVGAGDDGVYGWRAPKQLDASSESSTGSDGEWSDVEDDAAVGSGSEDNPLPPRDSIPSDSNDDSSESSDDSDSSHDSEFDPDEQPGVKLIIGGKSGAAIGRIYVPPFWKGLGEIQSSDEPHHYELIVLCEARDARAKDFSRVEDDGGWRYRVMLLEPKLDGLYSERVSIGSIGLGDLGEAIGGLCWKEITLG
ncbi:heterokaryon incompatibility protein-domain-containing protein [Lasiosphaeris hirsuta]|uniref:Heterokaryon incompatibility protein-domain-containing protein n=1 Tax=Lasiosphaeris hirsuta TaxID=260670 RepID=A0AA39ZS70_9PEZI|nr:heterokaryon incompatibility protein-domain-containing protein [Lasiosphaeris hirsuta]